MAKTVRECLYYQQFTDADGGSEIGIVSLASGASFTLAEMEKWLQADSARSCTVRCFAIPRELQSARRRIIDEADPPLAAQGETDLVETAGGSS